MLSSTLLTGNTMYASDAGALLSMAGSYDVGSYNNPVTGKINECRITAGIARDVSTIPTAPFPDS